MNLESFLKLIEKYDVEGFENVVIEGDLELELSKGDIQSLQLVTAYMPILQELQNFLYHANMAMSYLYNLNLKR